MTYTLHLPVGYEKQPFSLPWDFTQWLAALRSGKYGQGYGRLKHGAAYCCLGIGCELAGMKQTVRTLGGQTWFECNGMESATDVPTGVGGFFPKGVYLLMPNRVKIFSLPSANDKGLTFPQIADVAEQVWKP